MGYYKCPTCGKYAEKESVFNSGDKVQFAYKTITIKDRGSSIKISTKSGQIVEMRDQAALVRSRGKEYLVNKDRLSHAGEPNSLTVFFIGNCDCKSAG